MYHCRLQFYLIGPSCTAFDTIREMPPLAAFSHSFSFAASPEKASIQAANVILVNLG